MPSATECFDKSAEFVQRAKLAKTHDKQSILYGMAWMWMNLSKHTEVRKASTIFQASPVPESDGLVSITAARPMGSESQYFGER